MPASGENGHPDPGGSCQSPDPPGSGGRSEVCGRFVPENFMCPAVSFQWTYRPEPGKRNCLLRKRDENVRYEAFYRAVKGKNEWKKVAVAHHQNDQAETFLFRVARGTGLEGAGAMKPADFPLIRPLLCMQKQEIIEALETMGQDWVEDASNEDTAYARNQIRCHVIPPLEEVNPRAVAHIASLTEDLQEAGAFLEKEIRNACQKVVEKQENRRKISVTGLKDGRTCGCRSRS